jgi:hypothetical protein
MKLLPSKYDKSSLDELFHEGTMPEPAALAGEWRVDMLTGIVPSMYRLNHRKVIEIGSGGGIFGSNVLFRDAKWGYFYVEKIFGRAFGFDDRPALLIDYNRTINGEMSRNLRDYVRCLAPGLFLGRFCYQFGSRLIFLGYFTLAKID